MILDTLSWILLLAGGGFCVVGAVGMVRMPDFYTRMHAASVTDTLGALLILTGLLLQAGPTQTGIKLVVILVLLLFTSPAAAHALAKAAMARDVRPLLAGEDEKSNS